MGNQPTLIASGALGVSVVGIAHSTQKSNALEKRLDTSETRLRQTAEEVCDVRDTIDVLRRQIKEQETEIRALKATIFDVLGETSSTPQQGRKHSGPIKNGDQLRSIKPAYSIRQERSLAPKWHQRQEQEQRPEPPSQRSRGQHQPSKPQRQTSYPKERDYSSDEEEQSSNHSQSDADGHSAEESEKEYDNSEPNESFVLGRM